MIFDILKSGKDAWTGKKYQLLDDDTLSSFVSAHNDSFSNEITDLEKLNTLYETALEKKADWFVSLSQQANGAKLSLEDVTKANEAAIKSIESIGIKNKLKGFGKNLLKSLSSGLISGVVSWALSEGLNKIINHYQDKVKEQIESINDLQAKVGDYVDSSNEIDAEIEKYKELKTNIDSGTLSISEYRDAKLDLIGIQDSLIEKYGDETTEIDLLNKSIEKNILLIEEQKKLEAQQFLEDQSENIRTSKEFLSSTDWRGWFSDSDNKIIRDERDLSSEMIAFLKAHGAEFETVRSYDVFGDEDWTNAIYAPRNMTREEAYEYFQKLSSDLNKAKHLEDDPFYSELSDFITSALTDIDVEQVKISQDVLNQVRDLTARYGEFGEQYQETEAFLSELREQISSGLIEEGAIEEYSAKIQNFYNLMGKMDADTLSAWKELFTGFDFQEMSFLDGITEELNGAHALINEIKQTGITSEQLLGGLTDGLSDGAILQWESLKSSAVSYGMTVEDLINQMLRLGYITPDVMTKVSKAFNERKTEVENLVSEISGVATIANESTISADQYNELIGYSEDYADALRYEADGVSLNADAVAKLTDARIEEQKAAIKEEKTLAKLDYMKQSKDVRKLINEYKNLERSSQSKQRADIEAGLTSLKSIGAQIQQYDLLIAKLDEAGSKLTAYESAKSQEAYGAEYDTASDAFKSIDTGFTSGKVGTKEFEAAVAAMVPEINREDIESIYDYYFNELSKYFKYDDSGNLTREGLENFVQDALDAGGLFTEDSTLEDFTVENGIKLQDFADNLGMTKDAVIAMFGALEEYGYGQNFDFTDELLTSLEHDYEAIQRLTDSLYAEKAEMIKNNEYLDENGNVSEAGKQIDQNIQKSIQAEKEAGRATVDSIMSQEDALASYGAEAARLNRLLKESQNIDSVTNPEAWAELESEISESQSRIATLQEQIEEPTEIEIQIAKDYLEQEILEAQALLDNLMINGGTSAEIQAAEDNLNKLKGEHEIILKMESDQVSNAYSTLNSEYDKYRKKLDEVPEMDIDTRKVAQKLVAIKNYAQTVQKILSGVSTGDYTNYNPTGPGSEQFRATGTTTGVEKHNLNNVLGGELGPEMQIRDGQYRIIGEDGPELFDIKKNDIILNHKQTEDLRKHGKTKGRGLAFAGGLNNGPARVTGGLDWKSGWMREWASILGDGSGSSAASDAEEAFEELIDEIEILLGRIDAYISRLSTLSTDLYQTYQNKNKVVDEQIAVQTDKLGILAKSYDRYMLEANKVSIPDYWKRMVQLGQVDLESVTDEDLYNKIQEYQTLYDKAENCKDTILQTHVALRELNNTKLENITSSFEQMIALQESYIAKQTAANTLTEVMGEQIAEETYRNMMKTQAEISSYLTGERDRMQKEFDKMLADGSMKKYTEDWYTWTTKINELNTSIIESNTSTREYIDSIREVRWNSFNETIAELDESESELSSIESLIESIETHSEDGGLTNAGKTLLGIHAQQLATAKQRTAEYSNAIEALKKELANGNISQKQYNEQLKEYSDAQRQAASDTKAAKDAIVDLIVNGIEKETEAYNKLVDSKLKDLQATRDYQDYAKNLSEKQDSINAIKAQIAALSGSEENKTAVKKLQNELLQLTDEYNELKRDHEYDLLVQGYEDQQTLFEENQQAEIDRLNNDLAYQSEAITNYLAGIQDNYTQVYDYLGLLNEVYGQSFSDNVIGSWDSATAAVQTYVDAVNKAQAQADIDTSNIPIPSVSSQDMPKADESSIDEVLDLVTKKPPTSTGGSSGSSGSSNNLPKVSETTGYIQYGDTGSNVSLLQDALNKLGYNSGNVDGIFGDKTYAALTRFQSDKGIGVDGIVGPETREKFKAAGFFDGGLVASALNRMVKVSGEDGIALVRNKEAILNPEQAKDFQTLIQNLKPINDMASYLASKSPANIGGTQNSMVFHIDQHIDHIDTFSKDLSSTLMEHTKKSAEYTVNLIKQQGRKLGFK